MSAALQRYWIAGSDAALSLCLPLLLMAYRLLKDGFGPENLFSFCVFFLWYTRTHDPLYGNGGSFDGREASCGSASGSLTLLSLQIIAFSLPIDHQTTPFCWEIRHSFGRIAAVALQHTQWEFGQPYLVASRAASQCAPQSCQLEPHAIDATRYKK